MRTSDQQRLDYDRGISLIVYQLPAAYICDPYDGCRPCADNEEEKVENKRRAVPA